MFFKQSTKDNTYYEMAESIKQDLAALFVDKGIGVDKIQIDLKSGKLNLEVTVAGERKGLA